MNRIKNVKFKMHVIHVTLSVMGHNHWGLMIPGVLTSSALSSKVDKAKEYLTP